MAGELTRRRLLQGAGAAGVGLGLGGGIGYAAGQANASEGDGTGTGTVPFDGVHQAGIATAQQDRLHFAAFDLVTDRVEELRELMSEWTDAAREMTAGEMIGTVNDEPFAPPDDTGEAVGLLPSRLTVTFGFGPSIFAPGRFGLTAQRPDELEEIPPLPGDELDPALSGGDLCVQACADDPQTAFYAVRNLARIGRGRVVMRWTQLGFGRTSSTSQAQATPRNLMGFKDGTANIRAEETEDMDRFVWVADDSQPEWMRGGSYMVTRRIRMLLEVWDRSSLRDQERTFGRAKYSGAPLSGTDEFDELNLEAEAGGVPVIPAKAHARLASQQVNGQRILRRGYSFTDGAIDSLGQLDAGLFFIAFQRDPRAQFVPIQRRLGGNDALNEYISHRSSALFAVPPGTAAGGYIGEPLLG